MGPALEVVEYTDPASPWAWGSEPKLRQATPPRWSAATNRSPTRCSATSGSGVGTLLIRGFSPLADARDHGTLVRLVREGADAATVGA